MNYKLQPNPLTEANTFSFISFWWINDIFKQGYNKKLEISDLYELEKNDTSAEVCRKLEKNWNDELERSKHGKKASLTRALVRTFTNRLVGTGLLLLFLEFARLSMPILLIGLLEYFENEKTTPVWMAYCYAAGITVSALFITMFWHYYMFIILRIGWHLRISICAIMYNKTLRLSQKSLNEATTGKIVNLSATDVLIFDNLIYFLHYLWIGPLYFIGVSVVLWIEVGLAAFAGMGTLLGLMIVQTFIGLNIGKIKNKIAMITDGRIRLMNEIIAGIRIIKMYVWEKPFSLLVNEVRRKEIRKIFQSAILQSTLMSLYVSIDKVLTFVTIAVYIWQGGEISASKLFPVLSLFQILRVSVARGFGLAISKYFTAMVSINRAQSYLLLEENTLNEMERRSYSNGKSFVEMKEYAGEWKKSEESDDASLTLDGINLQVKAGELLAVIGPVGSGKSSILSAILGQLPTCAGLINVNGEITFANQVPWVFSGTVKENILFGEEFDEEWFNEVVQACALDKDIESFPHGSETLVGERGVTLSGGQKARVNLARAVYRKDASICLLDDPLSAVDAAVGNHIFQHCICGLLKDKVCILVTHQLYFLKKVNKIIILKEGKIVSQGTYDELQADGTDFAALLQKQETEDEIADLSITEIEKTSSQEKLIRCSDERKMSSQHAYSMAEIPEEEREEGGLSGHVYIEYFRVGVHAVFLFLYLFLTLFSQAFYVFGDWWIAYWTGEKEKHDKELTEMNSLNVTFVRTKTSGFDTIYFLTYYGVINICGILCMFIRCIFHFYVSLKSSENMHNKMFKSILRAPIRFFDTNPVGRVLNRFSKDMRQIDEMLPFMMLELTMSGLLVVSTIILMSVINYFILIYGLLMLFYALWVRRKYLRTSCDIKRLEGTTRSPVFSLLSSTLDGMTTIRALKVEKEFERKFHQSQDLHSCSWFIFIAGCQWLGIRLLFATSMLISIAVFLSVITSHLLPVNAGLVGLTLTYAFAIISISEYAVRNSAEVENLMTSVERVQQYYYLPKEADPETQDMKLPSDWPKRGKMTFKNVSFAYYEGGQTILKNISFKIRESEKIGIVGRTGAGKSSLISALFRLAELTGGEIYIDGIPITPLGLNDLRKVISIIPQDPVLFTGTMRYNLDPFSYYKDEELWNALEQVQVKEVVESLPLKLSSELAESGSNFSVGQRQLVCLARAVLRKSKILVIDEATANVDLRTDRLIQLTIREKFKHCTVLTIAHRLNTIIDSDRVMVVDNGHVKEFDEPYVLLHNRNSMLSQFAEKCKGGQMELLRKLAKQAHDKREEAKGDL